MKEASFLYTDGRNVVITPAVLQIKRSSYNLNGITSFRLAFLRPQLVPGFLVTLVGLVLIAENLFHFIPVAWYSAIQIAPNYSYSNTMMIVGIIAAVIGLIFLAIARRRYALGIETAEGEKLVVISRSKQYVDQILIALRKLK